MDQPQPAPNVRPDIYTLIELANALSDIYTQQYVRPGMFGMDPADFGAEDPGNTESVLRKGGDPFAMSAVHIMKKYSAEAYREYARAYGGGGVAGSGTDAGATDASGAAACIRYSSVFSPKMTSFVQCADVCRHAWLTHVRANRARIGLLMDSEYTSDPQELAQRKKNSKMGIFARVKRVLGIRGVRGTPEYSVCNEISPSEHLLADAEARAAAQNADRQYVLLHESDPVPFTVLTAAVVCSLGLSLPFLIDNYAMTPADLRAIGFADFVRVAAALAQFDDSYDRDKYDRIDTGLFSGNASIRQYETPVDGIMRARIVHEVYWFYENFRPEHLAAWIGVFGLGADALLRTKLVSCHVSLAALDLGPQTLRALGFTFPWLAAHMGVRGDDLGAWCREAPRCVAFGLAAFTMQDWVAVLGFGFDRATTANVNELLHKYDIRSRESALELRRLCDAQHTAQERGSASGTDRVVPRSRNVVPVEMMYSSGLRSTFGVKKS